MLTSLVKWNNVSPTADFPEIAGDFSKPQLPFGGENSREVVIV